jgi:hypothetical protein
MVVVMQATITRAGKAQHTAARAWTRLCTTVQNPAIHHAYVRHQESSLGSAPHRAQNKKRCFQASAGFFLSGAE